MSLFQSTGAEIWTAYAILLSMTGRSKILVLLVTKCPESRQKERKTTSRDEKSGKGNGIAKIWKKVEKEKDAIADNSNHREGPL